jgi:hypothetical protein
VARIATPTTPDGLKLAHARLKFIEEQDKIDARRLNHPYLRAFLGAVVVYTFFLMALIALNAFAVVRVPWSAVKWMCGAHSGALAAGGLLFREPLKYLYRG